MLGLSAVPEPSLPGSVPQVPASGACSCRRGSPGPSGRRWRRGRPARAPFAADRLLQPRRHEAPRAKGGQGVVGAVLGAGRGVGGPPQHRSSL
eukprot:1800706-Pyramimonas_sp.AAC.1